MAENRLFQMVYLLLERGTMTAPQLAAHYEVSVRTIYRDIDALNAAGIPVYTTPGRGGGISIQKEYVLNKSLLSAAEQEQILMALQGIRLVDSESTSALLNKLSGVFQKNNMAWIEVDFSDWQPARRDIFDQIKKAIFQRARIAFTYYGGSGEITNRTAEPLKLVFKSKDWFLYAYCCRRQDFRLFKLSRIRRMEITGETFERTAPAVVFADSQAFSFKMVSLTLLFDREMAHRVYDIFGDIEPQVDGRYLVHTEMPDNSDLYRHLLAFGEQMEVLAPLWVRESLWAKLKKMQWRYET